MLKKCLTFLLLLLLIFTMVLGCGNTATTSNKNEQPSTQSPTQESLASSENTNKTKPDFPKKNITYIVPTSPGGGYDTLSRMFIPYWEKNLPNNTKILVENIPGAEWLIGVTELHRAAPDGYTVGILNIPGNATEQILGAAQYDLNEFVPIGRINDVVYILAASKQSGIKSLEDLKNTKGLKAGVVGLSTTAGLGSVIASDRFELDFTPIPHDGSNEALLSAIKGVVDYVQFPVSSAKPFIDSGDLEPILVYADERLQDYPEVPTIKELGYEDLLSVVQMHRVVVASPGTPDDVADILREAFEKALEDPEFIEKIIDLDGEYNPANAETTGTLIKNSLVEFEKYKDLLLQYRK